MLSNSTEYYQTKREFLMYKAGHEHCTKQGNYILKCIRQFLYNKMSQIYNQSLLNVIVSSFYQHFYYIYYSILVFVS